MKIQTIFSFINLKSINYCSIIVLLFYSCSRNEILEVKKFPSVETVYTEEIDFDYTLGEHDIHLIDDSLALFFTLYDSDFCLRIINLNNMELLKSAGRIGKGPGEIINPGYIFIDRLKRDIWVSSGGKLYMYKFPIDSILQNENFIPEIKIDYDELVINYTIKDDSLYFFNTLDGEKLLYKRNNNKLIGLVDKHFTSGNKMQEYNYNFSLFKIHPLGNKIVVGFIHDDFLIIADTIGNIIKKIKGPEFIDPLKEKDGLQAAYQKIVVDKDFIYCLFRGGNKGSNDKYGRYIRNDAKTILVFDWLGNPIKKIKLDRSVYQFEIDQKNNRFLAYSTDVENGLISIPYEF